MTSAQWATWIGGAAATLAVIGMLYRQVVRPLARGIQRFADLIERLQDVLQGWPTLEANVLSTGQQLSELTLTVGRLDSRVDMLEKSAASPAATIAAAAARRRPPRKATP